MKLSVATYRASTERLNTLRQQWYGTLNNVETQRAKRRRGVSLESAGTLLGSLGENLGLGAEKYEFFVAPRSATAIGLVQEYESSVRGGPSGVQPWSRIPGVGGRGGLGSSSRVNFAGVMMVDGSPRRIVNPQFANNNTVRNVKSTTADPGNTSPNASAGSNALGTVLLIPGIDNNPGERKDTTGPVAPSDASNPAQRSSRSRWLKLRTTVQLSGAITQVHKKPPLKREDSFLERFSTRHIADPCSMNGSSRRLGDSSRGTFFGSWRSVVNPDENILFWWLTLLTMCLLYNAWTIIARQAFPEFQRNISPTWYAADGFSDLVFLLDIAFQFRTGYLEQGLMVYESKKLAGHYFRSKSFLMDIIAVTPLDLLQIWIGVLPIIRFPRFLKFYRSYRFYYMVESRTIYPNLWRVVNLIHILLLLSHWFGCFYYMLSELEGFTGSWSYPKPDGDYATLPRKYLGSVYWSTLTLTTIGDLATPATNLQYSFTIISYLIGVFIFATIVGQVGNVITNRNASRLEFERLLDGAKLYMRHHKVPRNMQRRVQRWYDYSWSRGRMQGGGDINSALGILPDKLKTELALHVNLKTLKKVSIFQECQPEFLHDLVLKMKAYIFTPGDLICRKGEVAREMFIIADGVLEVISETGKVLTQMKAGDFFGEIGILNLDGFNRRTADVRSVGYSELFSLSREDILTAMKDYPEAQEILQTMGRKRLMEARLAANMSKNPKEDSQGSKRSAAGIDPTKRHTYPQKPRTAVKRFKEDVKSLKKLLRSRSTPTGKAYLSGSDEQVMELKPMRGSPNLDQHISNEAKSTSSKRRASIKTIIKKIHFQGDSQTSPSKAVGLRNRLSSMRHRFRESGQSCSIVSRTDSSAPNSIDSADSNSHLNKALPLLQRIRLLGEQEKAKAAVIKNQHAPSIQSTGSSDTNLQREIIGEGLPMLERLKLLKAREQAATAGNDSSPGILRTSSILKDSSKPQVPSLASSKKIPSLSTRIASVIGSRSSNTSQPNVQETRIPRPLSPPKPDPRRTEFNTELPLLKKVLLMKMMDEKNIATTSLQSEVKEDYKQQSSSSKDERSHVLSATKTLEAENDSQKTSSDILQSSNRAADNSIKNVSKFATTPTVDVAKSSSVQSVNVQATTKTPYISAKTTILEPHQSKLHPTTADSRRATSTKEKSQLGGIVSNTDSAEEQQPETRVRKDSTTAQLLRSNSLEGYSARKSTLSRMMALREDSDEHHGSHTSSGDDVSSDDPFVKNIECQTEVPRSTSSSPDTWSPQQPSQKVRPHEIPGTGHKIRKNGKSGLNKYSESMKRRSIRTDLDDGLTLSDDGIQDYLVKVMKHVKLVVKSYVLDKQQDLQNRVIQLEREMREKDQLIRRLKSGVYAQAHSKTSSTFDEVSSLDISSISSADESEESKFGDRYKNGSMSRKDTVKKAEPKRSKTNEAEDDILCPEEEALLQRNRPTSQRKSWTYGGGSNEMSLTRLRRKVLLNSKQSYSLDDEKCQATTSPIKGENLWKLEFAIPENPSSIDSSYDADEPTVQDLSHEDVAELVVKLPEELECIQAIPDEQVDDTKGMEQEGEIVHSEDEFDISTEEGELGGNDWEVQMLVQQFEKNIKQNRRHSSGEILSWQAVLGNRMAPNSSFTPVIRPKDEEEQVKDTTVSPLLPRRSNRKFSLAEDKLLRTWDIPQRANVQLKSMWKYSDDVSHPERSEMSTKLSPGENNSNTARNIPQSTTKLDKKTLSRRRAYKHRKQISFNELKPQQYPRKSSLPSVDSLYNVSVSKLTSMENNNISSIYRVNNAVKREPVLSIDPRFGSLENVNAKVLHRRHPWPRSPSSPNVTTDQHFWDSSVPGTEHCIPEWPSSPCLPTITEDDNSIYPSLTSSPCRSFSHDCLPSLPPSPLCQGSWNSPMTAGFWTTSSSKDDQSCSSTNSRQDAKEKQYSSDTKATLKDLKSESRVIAFAQSREDSVVIAIPECEPLLSPR